MLVLRRVEGEKIHVVAGGVAVTVVVTSAGSGWAKLGFEAPAGVRIYREEITPADVSELLETQRKGC